MFVYMYVYENTKHISVIHIYLYSNVTHLPTPLYGAEAQT